jgi:hypothetical protein
LDTGTPRVPTDRRGARERVLAVSKELFPLRIDISHDADSDTGYLEALAVRLRTELLRLDVDDVERIPAGPVPAGAKGPAADSVGSLLITLSDSATVAALVGLLQSWITRDKGRSITIQHGKDKIKVEKVPPAELAALIETWMNTHGRE